MLAQWIFLPLKKELMPSNIKNGFKAFGIWPLNYHTINKKMELAQIFSVKVRLEVQIEEILEQRGLLTWIEDGIIHYYVDIKAPSL